MGDFVSDGEKFSCPFCTGDIKLSVASSPMKGDGKNVANTDNYSLSAPGAQCTIIPGAPPPCTPSGKPVINGQSPLKIAGSPALGANCMIMCSKGGPITVSSSAQSAAHHDGASGALALAAEVAANDPIANPSQVQKAEEPTKEKEAFKKGNKDKNLSAKEKNRADKQRDGSPTSNTAQNKQFRGATKEIERKIGRKLDDDDIEVLHDEITKKNYSFHEIIEIGIDLFGETR